MESNPGHDLFLLQSLLVRKNKEFTDGMRTGKKHHELLALYNEIKHLYDLIFQQRLSGTETACPA